MKIKNKYVSDVLVSNFSVFLGLVELFLYQDFLRKLSWGRVYFVFGVAQIVLGALVITSRKLSLNKYKYSILLRATFIMSAIGTSLLLITYTIMGLLILLVLGSGIS